MTPRKLSAKKAKPLKLWAGYSDGKLDWTWMKYDPSCPPEYVPAIYRTRRECNYEDTRRVLITPAPAPKRRRK